MEFKKNVIENLHANNLHLSLSESQINDIAGVVSDLLAIKLPIKIIKDFKDWQKENADKDYQYDEINEFIASQGRGNMYSLIENISNLI